MQALPRKFGCGRFELPLPWFRDTLDCYLSGALVLTLARGTRSPVGGRGRVIDYRHFIDALKRKPQAFKGLVF